MKDPIIEPIRRRRDKHAKKFNYKIDAICEDLKIKEKKYTYERKARKITQS